MFKKLKNLFAARSNVSTKAVSKSVASPMAIENLEDRKLMASSLALGINANNIHAGTYDATVKMMRDTGTKSARVWFGFSSYDTRPSPATLSM
jgi:hypothetical protein